MNLQMCLCECVSVRVWCASVNRVGKKNCKRIVKRKRGLYRLVGKYVQLLLGLLNILNRVCDDCTVHVMWLNTVMDIGEIATLRISKHF